ncbi:hypothetical protein [Aeromonas popoffii]|uniref:hypothetical protein n=1 Tax=Aeromonas popoffii TaxID=70856 RepID=UPI0005A6174E|nr:hypothetical protein [Aeromonas popoffii]
MENNNAGVMSQEIMQLTALTAIEKKQFTLGALGAVLILYVFGNAILGFGLGFWYYEVITHHRSMNAMEIVVLIAGQIFITYKFHMYWMDKELKKLEIAQTHYMRETHTSLKKVDYFTRNPWSGLAVDIEAKEIAIIEGNEKHPTDTKPLILSWDKIKDIRYFEPDVSFETQTISINNGGLMGLGQNLLLSPVNKEVNKSRRLQAEAKAQKCTGLYFELDDIHKQQAFLRMPKQQAPQWITLFDKLFDGSLEPQPKPMEFPRPEDVEGGRMTLLPKSE